MGMAIGTGLDEGTRSEIAHKLGQILDDTYSLLVRTHIYHWNVKGPLFEPLHELLEEHYKALFEATDVVAERIRQLGFRAPLAGNETFPTGVPRGTQEEVSARAMVEDLLGHHEAAARLAREVGVLADESSDLVTTDMLSEQLAFHEKAAWMLRVTLDGWQTSRPA